MLVDECRLSSSDCRLSGATVGGYVGSELSDIGYRVLAVDGCCRTDVTPFSIVCAQLC
jgi:hypothetical protein